MKKRLRFFVPPALVLALATMAHAAQQPAEEPIGSVVALDWLKRKSQSVVAEEPIGSVVALDGEANIPHRGERVREIVYEYMRMRMRKRTGLKAIESTLQGNLLHSYWASSNLISLTFLDLINTTVVGAIGLEPSSPAEAALVYSTSFSTIEQLFRGFGRSKPGVSFPQQVQDIKNLDPNMKSNLAQFTIDLLTINYLRNTNDTEFATPEDRSGSVRKLELLMGGMTSYFKESALLGPDRFFWAMARLPALERYIYDNQEALARDKELFDNEQQAQVILSGIFKETKFIDPLGPKAAQSTYKRIKNDSDNPFQNSGASANFILLTFFDLINGNHGLVDEAVGSKRPSPADTYSTFFGKINYGEIVAHLDPTVSGLAGLEQIIEGYEHSRPGVSFPQQVQDIKNLDTETKRRLASITIYLLMINHLRNTNDTEFTPDLLTVILDASRMEVVSLGADRFLWAMARLPALERYIYDNQDALARDKELFDNEQQAQKIFSNVFKSDDIAKFVNLKTPPSMDLWGSPNFETMLWDFRKTPPSMDLWGH